MASRNGLNPKIRGPKGVGFGRALPAPFGFGNGIKPDGTNDYMTVPSIVGSAFPQKATVEFWAYKDTSASGYCVSILDTTSNWGINCTIVGSSRFQRFDTGGSVSSNCSWPPSDDGTKTHFVLVLDQTDAAGTGTASLYIDGTLFSVASNVNTQMPAIIGKFEFFRYAPYGSLYSNYLIDEFRFYKTALRQDQVGLNYNFRNGANPSDTEDILIWYQFEQFENLDFSVLQDGSDMRIAIRDLSGKKNHAQPFNLDTNATSSTYVLKSF